MSRYQSYPKYKDSGVEWLGKIPLDWNVVKLKYVSSLSTFKLSMPESTYVGMENISSGNGRYIVKDEVVPEGASISFSKGDVLFGKLRPYLAKSWLATFSGVCSSEFLVLRSHKLHPRFLNYYSLTNEFIERVNASTYGSKMPRASWEDIGLLPVPMCSYNLSEHISIFLDHETVKIDNLIDKQQQLIELLKEKRQAVISHAVTKGLNSEVPMKGSSVEWLGKVPAHWEVSPLKMYVDTRKGVAFKSADFSDSGVKVVKASDIKERTIRVPDVFLPQYFTFEYPKAVLNAGDIVISTVGSTPDVKSSAVGQIGRLPLYLDGSLLNQNTVVFSSKSKALNQTYLFYLIQTDIYRDHLDLHAHGTANQASLNIADMLNFYFACPPLSEQAEIVEHIGKSNSHFEHLESNCKIAIKLIQERRTALISAAVTGKIDVRNWVAPTNDTETNQEPQEATA